MQKSSPIEQGTKTHERDVSVLSGDTYKSHQPLNTTTTTTTTNNNNNSNNNEPDEGFNYLITMLSNQVFLSGIITLAVILPQIYNYLFTKHPLNIAASVLFILGLSYVWQRQIRIYKDSIRAELQRQSALKLMENEAETAEWLNHILERFWLIFEPVISDIVTSSVNPILEYYTPSFLDSIALTEFTLGTSAPRIVAFRSNPRTEKDTIRFEAEVLFQPKDPEDLSLTKGERNSRVVLTTRIGRGAVGVDVPVLVKEIGFSAKVSIQITTMSGFPYAKIVSVQFPDYPKVEFVLKPLKGMDLMDMPGLNQFLQKLIKDILGWLFVAPNAFILDLDTIMNGAMYASMEQACGVLMIRIYEARDLKNVETLRQSDPYTRIRLGGRDVAKTKVINNNLNPYWNETFYCLVKNLNDELDVQVLDEDLIKDRPLGGFKGSLESFGVNKNDYKMGDKWQSLSLAKDDKVKTKGELRWELNYYPIDDNQQMITNNNNNCKCGIMRITVHQAKELDESKSMVGEYNPFVDIQQNGVVVHKTKVRKRTNNPQWEDVTQIFIRDCDNDRLKFVVRDQRDMAHDPEVGDCEIGVKEILQMLKSPTTKTEWWTLRNAKSGKLRLTFAYQNVPINDHYVPPLSLSGSTVKPPAIGVLRVKVGEARGLKNFETVGKSDPYVNLVYAGELCGKTAIVDDSLDPLWNEIFYLLVQDTSLKGNLQLELYDYNNMSKDRFMGSSIFNLKQLLDSSELKTFDLPVNLESGKNTGNLSVDISYFPIMTLQTSEEETITKETKITTTNNSNNNNNNNDNEIQITTKEVKEVKIKNQSSNSGILRVEIHEVKLEEKLLEGDGYSQKKKPSPYVEFADISKMPQLFTNEIESLRDLKNNKSKSTPGSSRSRTLTGDRLINKSFMKEDGGDKNNFVEDEFSLFTKTLVFRSAVQKKTFQPSFKENCEMFVRDVAHGRLLIMIRDYDRKSEREKANSVIGKIDLDVKEIITRLTNETVEDDWFKLISPNTKLTGGSIGKVRLTASFQPVDVDQELLEDEEELYITNSGKLLLELVDARNLPAVDSSGTSDPYCNVRLNGEKVYKTKVQKKNNQHPKWHESTEISIFQRSNTRMTIDCRDWNQFEDNKLLGSLEFDLSQIVIGEKVDQVYDLFDEAGDPVVGEDGHQSVLHMKYTFTPDSSEYKKSKKQQRHRSLFQVLTNQLKEQAPVSGSSADVFASMGAVGAAAQKFLKRTKKEDADQETTESGGEDEKVAAKHLGVVAIHVLKAENLKPVDSNGYADPYVKVRLQKSQTDDNKSVSSTFTKRETNVLLKTKHIKKTLNPVWNESVILPGEFDPHSETPTTLTFSVKDHNMMGTGVEMGEFDLNLHDAVMASQHDFTKPFSVDIVTKPGELCGGENGILHLQIEFAPVGQLADLKKRNQSRSSLDSTSSGKVKK